MTAPRLVHVGLPGAPHDVTIEPGLLGRLGALVADVAASPKALLAVDERIAGDHGAVALGSLREAGYAVTVAPLVAREARKSLDAVRGLYEVMLSGDSSAGLDRSSPVVALGGGIVGDTAGFAAATFMRGLPLVQVPTTLLAMVDAAIGGKTGVNVPLPDGGLGKNMVGAIWQPRAVLVDPLVLRTLDPREMRCGLAECVKHALIADASLLGWLTDHSAAIQALEPETLVTLIEHSARIKVEVVEQDERETGRRALLNLGHTFAHALESRQELDLRHGEAVAIGLVAAAHCAARTGRLDTADEGRVAEALDLLGLPLRVPAPVEADALARAMRYDKKVIAGRRRLVLPVGLGAAEITDDVPADVVRAAWAHVGAASRDP
ncbi:MAG: 3-dehydroquinate synthase [Planctomycetota bacterium]|jgi:3-dehydroquinate synthase